MKLPRAITAASTFVGVAVCAVVASGGAAPGAQTTTQPTHTAPITFNRDIAPIIFKNCTPCHRPGESAPFNLISYEDVKRRARQIVQVTQSRYMPPWLPEPGYGEFVGERRLNDEQIERIRRWVEQGSVEGAPSDLPPPPKFAEGWQLGEPDLVVRMPGSYTLTASGTDVFRNFVI